MTTLQYSSSNSSGAFANTIGWIDFTGITIPANGSVAVTNSTPDNNYNINFTLTNNNSSTITPSPTPVEATAPFGNTGYLNVGGQVALTVTNSNSMNITLTGITVTDKNGIKIDNYCLIAADAEKTLASNKGVEKLSFITTKGNWSLIDMLSPISPTLELGPNISYTGNDTVNITGVIPTSSTSPSDPIFSTISPTSITATSTSTIEGKQAVAFGIMFNQNVSCYLDVEVSPNNKIIYVCPGKKQFFPIKSNKCCGTVTLSYVGENFNSDGNYISGNLGKYTLLNSGILLSASCHLNPGDYDILSFKVNDSSCNTPFTLNAVFTYALCECCKNKIN
ncbi:MULTISPECIES: CshA/CshB family fibrillar adhesin-related protein [Clostridium]|uniref:Surface adhesin CshA non-repetitive domain-containing protein n=1 Tax=Clostridium cadaveris TaxID=1529 RepID=A0A316MIC1_9CLOT|nr:CshA/CshB family fibrillar adhesin-related protein [Clostridium cadaveris]MDU4951176.1 CshA/CshB family fibrillar adhesin-related protein [Clostridium sp.]MDY4950609.1 CshA/CshB family fibrillar adhesin-related protein [Clostridium cadaveris]PWL52200.1 MAG: hypothetical protein DBY38_11530 [Clostridium cadaveris]UFH64888.1 hypothetical protein KQH81_16800 [Clostridium cadaveris]